MSPQDKTAAAARLRRALLAFQTAQNSLLGAHRRLKELRQAEVDAFWRPAGSLDGREVAIRQLRRAVATGRPLDDRAVADALGHRWPPQGACW